MTDLRFLGDWGIWQGLILALLLSAGAWILYRREVRNRRDSLRWLLPLLRAAVVFLIIMMLTGPVLHHRRMIGQLVRLLVVIDSSESMGLTDEDMNVGRKLVIAHELGWLPSGLVDISPIKAAEALRRARQATSVALSGAHTADLGETIQEFAKELKNAHTSIRAMGKKTPVAVAGKNTILREYWMGIGGWAVGDLTKEPAFPDKPSGTSLLEIFEAPVDWAENYGTRIRGYVHPPATGDYTFWISSDDNSELWLSRTDDISKKKLIARVPKHTGVRQWNTFGEQKSKKIRLEAGKRCYIEALHKEGEGYDNVAVGWQLPDGTMERPIPGSRLSLCELGPEAAEGAAIAKRLDEELLGPAEKLQELKPETDSEKILADLAALVKDTLSWENGLRESFLRSAEQIAESDNDDVKAALEKFDGASRWQRLQSMLLGKNDPLLKKLASQHDVELMALNKGVPETLWQSRAGRFGRSGEIPETLGIDPAGTFTDLACLPGKDAESDRKNEKEEKEDQEAAILIFSDGRHNSGDSPLHVSKILGNRGVKIFTVGMGEERSSRDLAVAGVDGPVSVFAKDRVKGKITLKDDMPAGEPFVLKIESEGQTLWEKRLATAGSGLRRVEYDFPIEKLVEGKLAKGEKSVTRISFPLKMTVSVPDLKGDRETKNNNMPLRTLVVLKKRKMLLVEGRPRWEWRYIRNLFERDEQWELSNVLLVDRRKEDTDKDLLPKDKEELFAYDLIIIGDVAPRFLKKKHLEWIRDFVGDRGGGLILIDGRRGHLRSCVNGPLAPLLPIKWTAEASGELPVRLRLTTHGRAAAALALTSDTGRNADLWTSLRPPRWVAPVEALPGTETLVECKVEGGIVPALVLRRFGSGRVLYTSHEESWRWRYKVADEYHQRYWNQISIWAMEAPYSVRDKRGALDSGAATYRPGESARIRARFYDEDGKPMTSARAKALLFKDGKQIATLPLAPDEKGGVFRAKTSALEEGEYEVRLSVRGIPEDEIKVKTGFVVMDPESGELTHLTCNETLLQQMASNAKGLYFREEAINEVSERLKPLSRGKIVESDTVLWQSYWWFVPMLILLTAEWIFRKRAGMM